MKKNILMITVVALFVAACGGSSTKEAATEETVAAEPTTYTVDASASTVAWKGEVAGVYGHNGVISISEGTITAVGDSITGGSIVIDMTTIQPLDSASYKPADAEQGRIVDLIGHLSTGDFFLVEEFPTSTFVIKSQTGNTLTGDLTVRGITKEETVTLSSVEVTESGLTGAGVLVFDRQDYDVKWVHYMKDMILSDDITLNISLSAK